MLSAYDRSWWRCYDGWEIQSFATEDLISGWRATAGLERPGGCSRPTPRRLASLVVADAFVGELTRRIVVTIPATVETENTRSYQGRVWPGDYLNLVIGAEADRRVATMEVLETAVVYKDHSVVGL
jgi:hypothetical protein